MKNYRIYVWGTGVAASEIFNEYFDVSDIVGFVESNPVLKVYLDKPVIGALELKSQQYDLVLVASNSAQEIYDSCIEMNLELQKFYFVYRHWLPLCDMNGETLLVEKIMGKNWLKSVEYDFKVITRNPYEYRKREKIKYLENSWLKKRDFVRVETLELLAKEIEENNIEGNIAELGVFRGEFSCCLNILFPDRKLYLFDTFESFGKDEFIVEKNNEHCNDEFMEAFKNTSCDLVLKNLPHKEQVKIIKGYFPQSMKNFAEEMEKETFAMVSLDVDFEQSIYEGIKYFYPKLQSGGYILLHDYNSKLQGVKKAVKTYEQEMGKLCKVPICDEFGTLIITKV